MKNIWIWSEDKILIASLSHFEDKNLWEEGNYM
jgi:hypothetical protein